MTDNLELSELDLEYAFNLRNDIDVNNLAGTEEEALTDVFAPNSSDKPVILRKRRQVDATEVPPTTNSEATVNASESNVESKRIDAYSGPIRLLGLRVDEAEKDPKIVDGMIPSVLRETIFSLRLFGEGFSTNTEIAFTHTAEQFGKKCHFLLAGVYKVRFTYHYLRIFIAQEELDGRAVSALGVRSRKLSTGLNDQ
jgi:hypothetical protein